MDDINLFKETNVPNAGSRQITSSSGSRRPYMREHSTVYAPELTIISLSGLTLHPILASKNLAAALRSVGCPAV